MESTNQTCSDVSLQTKVYTTKDEIKAFRVEVDALIQKAHALNVNYTNGKWCSKLEPDAEVYVHLIEAKMWLGKCLEAMGNEFPAELADKATISAEKFSGQDGLTPIN